MRDYNGREVILRLVVLVVDGHDRAVLQFNGCGVAEVAEGVLVVDDVVGVPCFAAVVADICALGARSAVAVGENDRAGGMDEDVRGKSGYADELRH